MISEHIKRNTYYTFVFNLSDAESVYAAIRHLQIDPKCSKMLSSLLPGYCIVRQTQASWSSAFLAKVDFVEPARNIGIIEYDQHFYLPAINAEQTGKIINELYKLVTQNKTKAKSKVQNSDIEKLSLKLIELWAKNPYTPVIRLFEQLGNIHYTIQTEVREYIKKKKWANFAEERIGRSPMMLMEITDEGYKILQIPTPEENQGRGSITHRHFANWIKSSFESKGCKAYLEWIVPSTSHPVDVAVEIDGCIHAYEICVSTTSNLMSHVEACFEKSNAVKKLTIVVATKTKLRELKKIIKSELMLARYEDRIQLDTVENYMKRN